ncbi:MAG: HAD family hydrolase [Anaerolineae bacterium]|nr:HAD family hydrolase [Anaerolineae bacterium]
MRAEYSVSASDYTPASLLAGAKAVLFDLDGTLRRLSPTDHEALLERVAHIGHTIEPSAQAAGVLWSHAYWADSARSNRDMNELDDASFWRNYLYYYLKAMKLADHQLHPISNQISEHFVEEFKPHGYLTPGAKELLTALKQAGRQVGLISNRHRPLAHAVDELGIAEYFDFTLAAGEIDIWKPDPRIFHAALDIAGGVAPEKAVYIGDNYYADVVGATQAGMSAILIDEHGAYEHGSYRCPTIRHFNELISALQ